MWLHPSFFSMGAWQPGQFFAFDAIHKYDSSSVWFLNVSSCLHVTTSWTGSPHSKQYVSPQLHSYDSRGMVVNFLTAKSQFGAGHQRIVLSAYEESKQPSFHPYELNERTRTNGSDAKPEQNFSSWNTDISFSRLHRLQCPWQFRRWPRLCTWPACIASARWDLLRLS